MLFGVSRGRRFNQRHGQICPLWPISMNSRGAMSSTSTPTESFKASQGVGHGFISTWKTQPTSKAEDVFDGAENTAGSFKFGRCIRTKSIIIEWEHLGWLIARRMFHIQVSRNGGTPKMDGWQWKITWKWMIWGYPHFRKCPYGLWVCHCYRRENIYPLSIECMIHHANAAESAML